MSWLSKVVKKVGHGISKGFKEVVHVPENVGKTLKGAYNAVNQSGYLPAIVGTGVGAYFGGPLGAMVGANLGGQYAQNQWNSEQARLANEWAINTWNMQNEYNTPANQISRLRASGLNPNLFYSQGNVGNASSVGSYTAAQHDYSFNNAIGAATAYAQLENMNVTNKNLQAQTRHINAQTLDLVSSARYREAMVDYFRRYGHFPNESMMSTIASKLMDLTGTSRYDLQSTGAAIHEVVDSVSSGIGKYFGKFSGNYKSDYRNYGKHNYEWYEGR